jgi:hypothetical protein
VITALISFDQGDAGEDLPGVLFSPLGGWLALPNRIRGHEVSRTRHCDERFIRKLRIPSEKGAALELHHHSNRELRFAAAKVREPDTAESAAAGRFRGGQVAVPAVAPDMQV